MPIAPLCRALPAGLAKLPAPARGQGMGEGGSQALAAWPSRALRPVASRAGNGAA